jgi:hypothetical protein
LIFTGDKYDYKSILCMTAIKRLALYLLTLELHPGILDPAKTIAATGPYVAAGAAQLPRS